MSIKQKMNDLRALHGKAALTTFDDSNSHEMEIEVLTQEITRLFRKAEVRLQQFGSGACTSEADEKVGSTSILLSNLWGHCASCRSPQEQ